MERKRFESISDRALHLLDHYLDHVIAKDVTTPTLPVSFACNGQPNTEINVSRSYYEDKYIDLSTLKQPASLTQFSLAAETDHQTLSSVNDLIAKLKELLKNWPPSGDRQNNQTSKVRS